MIKSNLILIGGAVIFKDYRKKRYFFVVKQSDETKWEFPKVTVRRGESSVRAVIRVTSEVAGMNVKILEEAGRRSGVVAVNGKAVPQKHFYYLMILKSAGETLGFIDHAWLEYGKAMKKLSSKSEQDILKGTREVIKEWEKGKPRVKKV
jgi:hypothetical protein